MKENLKGVNPETVIELRSQQELDEVLKVAEICKSLIFTCTFSCLRLYNIDKDIYWQNAPILGNGREYLRDSFKIISAAEFIRLNTEPGPVKEPQFKVGAVVITKKFQKIGLGNKFIDEMQLFVDKAGKITGGNLKNEYSVHGYWWPASALEHVKEQKPDLSGKGYSQFANKETGANPFKTDFRKNPLTNDQVFAAPESPVMVPLDEVIETVTKHFGKNYKVKDNHDFTSLLIDNFEEQREHYAQQPQLILDHVNELNAKITALENKNIILENELDIYKDLRKHH